MTLAEAGKLVANTVAAFPSYQEREMAATARAWHLVLGHLTYAIAQAALATVLATSRFWPAPAEILDAAIIIQNPGRLTAGEAWAEVCRELHRVGSWGTPQFGTSLIAHAVEAMGGWKQLCASEEPEVDRAHFLKIYGAIDERAYAENKLPPQVRQIAVGLAGRLALPRKSS